MNSPLQTCLGLVFACLIAASVALSMPPATQPHQYEVPKIQSKSKLTIRNINLLLTRNQQGRPLEATRTKRSSSAQPPLNVPSSSLISSIQAKRNNYQTITRLDLINTPNSTSYSAVQCLPGGGYLWQQSSMLTSQCQPGWSWPEILLPYFFDTSQVLCSSPNHPPAYPQCGSGQYCNDSAGACKSIPTSSTGLTTCPGGLIWSSMLGHCVQCLASTFKYPSLSASAGPPSPWHYQTSYWCDGTGNRQPPLQQTSASFFSYPSQTFRLLIIISLAFFIILLFIYHYEESKRLSRYAPIGDGDSNDATDSMDDSDLDSYDDEVTSSDSDLDSD